MILLSEIVEEIRSDLTSGMGYNDTRYDTLYLEGKVHAARAALIMQSAIKVGRMVNDAWIQTLDISFSERERDCDVVTFECPNVITLDSQGDGFMYVGHVNGMKPFPRIRKSFMTLTRHSLFSKKKEIMWDYKHLDQNRMLLQFYNNPKLEHVMVRAMFNNPTTIPNFDKSVDHYPVDAGLRAQIVQFVTADLIRKTQRPVEVTNTAQTDIPR